MAGDHASAKESWRQARSELEPFLQEQSENYVLIGDLALINMGLGDKAAALALSKRAMTVVPIEKDAVDAPLRLRFLPTCMRKWASPIAPSSRYGKYSRYRMQAHWLQTCHLLPRCSGSIPCSIRCGMIRVSKNSLPSKRQNSC